MEVGRQKATFKIFGVESLFKNLMPRGLRLTSRNLRIVSNEFEDETILFVIFRLDEVQSTIANAFSAG
jgi:hypothetical protein